MMYFYIEYSNMLYNKYILGELLAAHTHTHILAAHTHTHIHTM